MKKNDLICLATGNAGKIKEFNAMLPSHEIISYKEIVDKELPEETGSSFIENAIIKARFVSQHTNSMVLSDDSGLIVPELNYIPGIYSARFAGPNATDIENRLKLQDLIKQTGKEFLPAYFVCLLVLFRFRDDPLPLITTGKMHGFVSTQEKGQQGFGYDKMFYLDDKISTLASIDAVKKNSISHRAKAVKKLIASI